MIRHVVLILILIAALTLGLFRPYIPGEYDSFSPTLSMMIQVGSFVSLLFVPIGLTSLVVNFRARTTQSPGMKFIRLALPIVLGLVLLSITIAALSSNNTSIAVIVFCSGIGFIVSLRGSELYRAYAKSNSRHLSLYLLSVPLVMLSVTQLFLERAKHSSTNYVIERCSELIEDIESYRMRFGKYPVSLQSTIEDYRPSMPGIERFQYELNGESYNVYFEQHSDRFGTQEIVMYNSKDEHNMTAHNQDLLHNSPENIIRGYYDVQILPDSHWRIFYFD